MAVVKKIYEPDEGITHYDSPLGLDQVTLCGVPDWIGRGRGVVTEKPVSCNSCLALVQFVQDNTFS